MIRTYGSILDCQIGRFAHRASRLTHLAKSFGCQGCLVQRDLFCEFDDEIEPL